MSTVVVSNTNTVVVDNQAAQAVTTVTPATQVVMDNKFSVIQEPAAASTIITSLSQTDTIILSGIPGPPGPAGQSEEEMPYAKRVDSVSDTEMYKGEAAVGSLTSSATWRIQKVVFGIDGDVTITWADGNANFDNIWDNRLSLSYT